MSATSGLDALGLALSTNGIPAGLEWLNARVPHRLTGIYHLREGFLHSLFVYDKQSALTPEVMAVVPLLDSFCQFAMKDGRFLVDDSRHEPRLDGNPNQGVVVSYHAVPIQGNFADLFGTLCHFDMVPQSLPDTELDVLTRACKMMTPYVLRAAAGDRLTA